MTLRETIEQALTDYRYDDASADQAADAILAAIRSHMTSPEAVERAWTTYCNSPSAGPEAFNEGLLAALGEE
jgi:hypothetical protein